METKLNNSEVKEIAEMQQKIDAYEAFIIALFVMIKTPKDVVFPSFGETELDNQMNYIWKWVKEHK